VRGCGRAFVSAERVATPARLLALELLLRLESSSGTLAEVFATSSLTRLGPRDKALVHELVLGTLRRRGWLDHVLASFVETPARLAPAVRDVLRLGAYQLLFTRVPSHAAVSESVDLARGREPRAAGLVNAVLRRLARQGPPSEPEPSRDPSTWLRTAGSLPPWLAERWLARLGATAAVARARALLEPAPVHFRLNPRRPEALEELTATGLAVGPGIVPDVLVAAEAAPLGPLAGRGLLYIQDQGSQLVARLAAGPGRLLDACAAPGGKSLLASDLGGPDARVVAAESSRRRLATLADMRARWGASNVLPVGADATRPPFCTLFDSVLLDAPCSGLGTLARHPDIRWRAGPRDVIRHARRQARMLEAVAPLVRPGGRLVYATCSLEDEENLGVLAPFLEAHREFVLDDLPPWSRPFSVDGLVRIEPSRHAGDAFFAARLRRVGARTATG
jgi:16S rRNA (cytosine967-C5)-methyltransferase